MEHLSAVVDVFVLHLFELFDAFDPIIFDRIRQATENIVTVFHTARKAWSSHLRRDEKRLMEISSVFDSNWLSTRIEFVECHAVSR